MDGAALGILEVSVRLVGSSEEVRDHILSGVYEVSGLNHGRRTYKKVQDKSVGESVWLYYWDMRDGVDMSGWWFGRCVGSDEVWAGTIGDGSGPPRIGWEMTGGSDLEMIVDPRPARQVTSHSTAGGRVLQPSRRPNVGSENSNEEYSGEYSSSSDDEEDFEWQPPKPWRAIRHGDRVYYWNPTTEASVWDPPPGSVHRDDRGASTAAASKPVANGHPARKLDGNGVSKVEDSSDGGAQQSGSQSVWAARRAQRHQIDGPSSGQKIDQEHLNAQWQAIPHEGRTYYWNAVSGESLWELPPGIIASTQDRKQPVQGAMAPRDVASGAVRNRSGANSRGRSFQQQRRRRSPEKLVTGEKRQSEVHVAADPVKQEKRQSELQVASDPVKQVGDRSKVSRTRHRDRRRSQAASDRKRKRVSSPPAGSGSHPRRRREPSVHLTEADPQELRPPGECRRSLVNRRRRRHSLISSEVGEESTGLPRRSRSRNLRRRPVLRPAEPAAPLGAPPLLRLLDSSSRSSLVKSRSPVRLRGRSSSKLPRCSPSPSRRLELVPRKQGLLAQTVDPLRPGELGVNFRGKNLGDAQVLDWLKYEAPTLLHSMPPGVLECVDFGKNDLGDEALEAVVHSLLDARRQVKRIMFFGNRLRNPLALCDFMQDHWCGLASSNGPKELHLSDNYICLSAIEQILDCLTKYKKDSGYPIRPPFWIRAERNGLSGDGEGLVARFGRCGLDICLVSRRNRNLATRDTDVHLYLF
eukprot:TRINITY_DN19452_c0_g1_i2.p1 TRINITY_DN19452_c0_g1~~TRINITY_DN19452_c0_g1_i2.p1  ORF type:complete len:775 (+),score=109.98 TRINITY_DN19452_c0_g1_i2:78-2327(+)